MRSAATATSRSASRAADECGMYGSRFGRVFGLAAPPAVVARSTRDSPLAATEIRGDSPAHYGMSRPIPREDAYLVGLQLRDFPNHHYWEDGRKAPVADLAAGQTLFYDLTRNPVVDLQQPFHSIHFYLPRAALDDVARGSGARPVAELEYRPGIPVSDPVVQHIGLALAPAFRAPQPVTALFVDAMTRALCTHVCERYGGMRPAGRAPRGRLAPWQERRAKDLLRTGIDSDVSIARLAQECRLSPGHFARAFRETTGVPPHRWLLQCRIERARDLLAGSAMTLSEIALAAGFADQSHLTRTFTQAVGVPPGAWRRRRSCEPPQPRPAAA